MEAGNVDAFRRFRLVTWAAFVGLSLAGSAAVMWLHDDGPMAPWVVVLVVAVSAFGAVSNVLGCARDLATEADRLAEVARRSRVEVRACAVESGRLRAELAEAQVAVTREAKRRETQPW